MKCSMIAVGIALVLGATGTAAQQPTQTSTASQRIAIPRPASPDAVPRWSHKQESTRAGAPAQPMARPARGEAIALMIAGGAVFVAGAITGGGAGALLMVGGALAGGYGIYLHFR